ncbi:MAG: hypothetical protein AAGA35_04435 [Patescibacteria group bacterium]
MFETVIVWATEDILGTAIQLYFAAATAIALVSIQKPPVATSVMMGVGLILLGSFGSFVASATATAAIVGGVVWLLVALQVLLNR